MGRLVLLVSVLCGASGCIPPPVAPPSAPIARQVPQADEAPPSSDPAPLLVAEFDTIDTEVAVWEARPVIANAIDVTESVYTVVPGDTLRGIGERTGAGSETIARANGLVAPFVIKPGQRLAIPGGRFHKVSGGETGIAIAKAYGTQWRTLIELNGLSEPYTLRPGQRLILPGDAEPSDAAIEARAAAFTLNLDDVVTGGEPATEITATQGADAPVTPDQPVLAPAQFAGSFAWPAAGRVVTRFGVQGEGNISQGLDIAVAPATPIRAAGSGVVAFVGNEVANYGGLILIKHGSGWITAYGRAAQASVKRGQRVARGDVIGRTGSGAAPQLFFQMRKNQVPVDPLTQLPPR